MGGDRAIKDENLESMGWVLIPPQVMAATDISAGHKIILGKILGLLTSKGYCWASNRWLSENTGFKADTVSKYITDLAEKKYITREIVRDENNKVVERRLFPVYQATPPGQSSGTLQDNHRGPSQTIIGDYVESREESREEIKDLRSAKPTGQPKKKALAEEDRQAQDALRLIGRLWNKQPKLVTHGKSGLKAALPSIKARLRDGHTVEELAQAIRTLNDVITDPKSWWTYSGFTLKDFLGRQSGAVMERFLAGKQAFIDKKRGASNAIHQRGKELTDGFFD